MEKRIRIISGLVLFVFVTMHLINVALGLHSVEMMDRARPLLMGAWTNPAGTFLLTLSLGSHFALGLLAIYRRSTLRLSPTDTVQMIASLAIVPLLVPHVVGTAIAARYGVVPSFASLIPYFWIDQPLEGLRQVVLLAVLWIHGCIGVYTWARIQPWWARAGAFLYPFAVAIPVLGLLGFVEAGNQVIAEGRPPLPPMQLALPFEEILAILKSINWTIFYVYVGLVVLVLVARQLRVAGDDGLVRVSFDGGMAAVGTKGMTLLDIARLNDVPMANLCRGRGRCGTCRVEIANRGVLPLMEAEEEKTLARVGALAGTRLSCQLALPAGEFKVRRLVPPFLRARDLHRFDEAHRLSEHGAAEAAE